MKKILLGMVAVMLLVAACTPEKFDTVVFPRNVVQRMEGTWKLNKVLQTDNDASRKGFPYKSLDITSYYPFNTASITFGAPNNGTGSFTYNAGQAPALTGINTGTWTTDNAEAPNMIRIASGATRDSLQMGSYTKLDENKLNLRVIRIFNGKPVTTYDYEFVKQ